MTRYAVPLAGIPVDEVISRIGRAVTEALDAGQPWEKIPDLIADGTVLDARQGGYSQVVVDTWHDIVFAVVHGCLRRIVGESHYTAAFRREPVAVKADATVPLRVLRKLIEHFRGGEVDSIPTALLLGDGLSTGEVANLADHYILVCAHGQARLTPVGRELIRQAARR